MSDKSGKSDIFSVAKAARVSPSTVSRYFNHPELLKPATRRRVDRAVRKTGYIRNRAAQTIHGIRSGTIGVVVPSLEHTIFAEVVQAFSETVAEHGFTILLASHGYDLQREYEILRKLLEHRVDGIILTGLDHDEAVFHLVESQTIPALCIWNHAPDSPLPCVGADNAEAGRMIADHVLSLGHRDIACMFPPVAGNDRAQGRQRAVLSTLARAGVSVPEAWQLETVYSIGASKRDSQTLLQASSRPTALICGNDVLAIGALYGAAACGMSVPEDLSVVGIGDFKGSAEVEPALTTIRLPARRIGREAGEAIAHAITEDSPLPRGIHCAPTLMVRRSCARAGRAAKP